MDAPDDRRQQTAKPTIATRLTETLRDDILNGRLEPGERLNLDRMREGMKVSVSSLREAVTRLVAVGLVEAEEQKGYRVAPISLDNLAEITQLRSEIEPMALQASIRHGSLEWETQVMAALYRLNRTERNTADTSSVEGWETAHNAFHRALIADCRMPLLLRFANVLHNMNDRYRRIFLATQSNQRNLANEHTAIAEAAVARRGEEAAELLAAHLQRTGTALQKLLSQHLPEHSD